MIFSSFLCCFYSYHVMWNWTPAQNIIGAYWLGITKNHYLGHRVQVSAQPHRLTDILTGPVIPSCMFKNNQAHAHVFSYNLSYTDWLAHVNMHVQSFNSFMVVKFSRGMTHQLKVKTFIRISCLYTYTKHTCMFAYMRTFLFVNTHPCSLVLTGTLLFVHVLNKHGLGQS